MVILGRKIGMTQVFSEDGTVIPVTVIEAGPCPVVQVKSKEKDGYLAVQLGFQEVNPKSVNRAQTGHFKKGKSSVMRFLREVRTGPEDKFKLQDLVKVDIFSPGEMVDVTGVSIGKGFQGGMKRWGWSSGPDGHGSMSHRAPGSIGASSDPSRVYKGHHLPGHMGNRKVTVQHLEVIKVDLEKNLLLVKGALPGKRNSFLMIRKAKKLTKKDLKKNE